MYGMSNASGARTRRHLAAAQLKLIWRTLDGSGRFANGVVCDLALLESQGGYDTDLAIQQHHDLLCSGHAKGERV